MACAHPKVTKRYVGSAETYEWCGLCVEASGGEETPAKRTLLRDACAADVTERDEVEGLS